MLCEVACLRNLCTECQLIGENLEMHMFHLFSVLEWWAILCLGQLNQHSQGLFISFEKMLGPPPLPLFGTGVHCSLHKAQIHAGRVLPRSVQIIITILKFSLPHHELTVSGSRKIGSSCKKCLKLVPSWYETADSVFHLKSRKNNSQISKLRAQWLQHSPKFEALDLKASSAWEECNPPLPGEYPA